ncbi:MAG: PulJ/GspJ family protein [Planctomycetota bacterium]|jgi:type II secretory pathway pseudopilin PulG
MKTSQTPTSTPSRRRRRSVGRAFTIIEMLVTVTAMSIIVAAFGSILVQCKRVVTMSYRTMRANHRVAVITESFRRDFRRLSRDGFLFLSSSGGSGAISLTTGDATESVLGDAKGLGSIVAYGLTTSSTLDGGQPSVLCRPEFIFADDDSASYADTDTALGINVTMQNLRAESVAGYRGLADKALNTIGPVPMPPDDMSDADQLWRVLSDKVVEFGVDWTTGKAGSGDPVGDFIWQPASSDIWTARNLHNWPMAVKISYRIEDEDWPEGYTENHQVVCEILP